MLPEPLHPAVVHFPIVLAFLMPLAVGWAVFAIRRGAAGRRAWAPVSLLAALLFASAFVSLRTGQAQEETVEETVGDAALHGHEEGAERFLIASGVLLGLAALGLAGGLPGTAGRAAAAVGSLVVAVLVFQVGRTGGELVYTHGAAAAYVGTAPAGAGEPGRARVADEDDDEGGTRGRSRSGGP